MASESLEPTAFIIHRRKPDFLGGGTGWPALEAAWGCGPLWPPLLSHRQEASVLAEAALQGCPRPVAHHQAMPREVVTKASSCFLIPRWLVPTLRIHVSEPCLRKDSGLDLCPLAPCASPCTSLKAYPTVRPSGACPPAFLPIPGCGDGPYLPCPLARPTRPVDMEFIAWS